MGRRIGPDHIPRHSVLNWIQLVTIGVIAATLRLAAAESPGEAERVGELGRKEALVFEGTQAFSSAAIVKPMEMRLEFYGKSDPGAPLSDYLAWIERIVRQGYQRSGFAKVAVTATADRPAQRIRVKVAEGPRFGCGGLKFTGLEPLLTQQLTNRLLEAAELRESSRSPGQPSFSWSWREGEHLPADPESLDGFKRSVVAALGELNRRGAEAQVELGFAEERRQADLLVHVTNPGVAGILDQIQIEGLRVNSREDLLSFLQLRPGMPMTGNVTNDALRRLWGSGRFSGHLATLSPLPALGRFKLELAVVEFTNAPPLKQELTAEERAFLKLREWLLNWRDRPEDWLLKAESLQNGRHVLGELVLGKEGLAVAIKQTLSNSNPPTLAYGLIAASQHVGYYSGQRRSKLAGTPKTGQLLVSLAFNGNPDYDDSRGSLSFGAVWNSEAGGTPYLVRLDLAPVAFVGAAHPLEGACRVEQGILTVRSEPDADPRIELTAEAATGRLIEWQLSPRTNGARFVFRSEEGAFARVAQEVATLSAGFTDELDGRHPWSSSLSMLGRDLREVLERSFPEVLDFVSEKAAGGFTTKELLGAVTMLENLPWRELLTPLDLLFATGSEPDAGEDFPFVLEGSLPSLEAGNQWLRLVGGMILRVDDDLWPRGSWPWAVMRDATLLAAGQAQWATNDIARLEKSGDTGPLACLVAAHALGRFSPPLAVAFAQQGAARLTPAALQKDLRLLLSGEKAGQQFLQTTLRRAPAFKENDLRAFMKLIGTNAFPMILDSLAAIRTNPHLSPDEALRPVIEGHWEKEIRPQLLTTFAELYLGGFQKSESSPSPAQARQLAGWVQAAADQGYATAQMLLGQFYVNSVGVPANAESAAMWMGRAAEQDYPHAACALGRLYFSMGNRDQAARWFRRGSQEGCSAAEIGLARLLLGESGVTPEQREEALTLLQKAADRGALEAQMELGNLYERQGKMEEALNWYRQAALKGGAQAQARLGDMLSDGISTRTDYVEAWVWLKLAASQGNRPAATQARSIERNKLKPEQLEEAKRRLRQIEKTPGERPAN